MKKELWLRKWEVFRVEKDKYVEFVSDLLHKRSFVRQWITNRNAVLMVRNLHNQFKRVRQNKMEFVFGVRLKLRFNRLRRDLKRQKGETFDIRATKEIRNKLTMNGQIMQQCQRKAAGRVLLRMTKAYLDKLELAECMKQWFEEHGDEIKK